MRAALYCRVSTEEQARSGLSMGDQLAALRAYAAQHGHTVTGEYSDPGISARARYTRRPGLLRLLEDIQAGKVETVLFTRLDRWVRSVRDYYKVQEVLDAAGVTWRAILEDYETATTAGRFKVNIMLSVAQNEADQTGDRIRFTCAQARARGESTNGRAPLGYRIVNKRPQLDPATQEAARGLFEAYLATGSIPAARRHVRETYGVDRAYGPIQRALANPVYKGEYLGVPGAAPALLTEEEWARVQELLHRRAPRGAGSGRVYLFSGLAVCEECGRALNASTLTKGGRDYIYYRCPGQYQGGTCLHRHRVREDRIEEYLLSQVVPLAQQFNIAARVEDDPRPRLAAKIRAIRGKQARLQELYTAELVDLEAYRAQFEALRAERAALEAEAARYTAPRQIDAARLMSALELYQDLSRAGRREFWARLIRRIRVTDSGDFFIDFV